MKPLRDGTHSVGCTAVAAHHAGRLQSPWSATHRIEEATGPAGVCRWYIVPCADPRCRAVQRTSFDRPEMDAFRSSVAA